MCVCVKNKEIIIIIVIIEVEELLKCGVFFMYTCKQNVINTANQITRLFKVVNSRFKKKIIIIKNNKKTPPHTNLRLQCMYIEL